MIKPTHNSSSFHLPILTDTPRGNLTFGINAPRVTGRQTIRLLPVALSPVFYPQDRFIRRSGVISRISLIPTIKNTFNRMEMHREISNRNRRMPFHIFRIKVMVLVKVSRNMGCAHASFLISLLLIIIAVTAFICGHILINHGKTGIKFIPFQRTFFRLPQML